MVAAKAASPVLLDWFSVVAMLLEAEAEVDAAERSSWACSLRRAEKSPFRPPQCGHRYLVFLIS